MRNKTLATTAALRLCVAAAILVALTVAPAVAALRHSSGRAITGVDVANKADRVVITVQGNCALNLTPIVTLSSKYLGFQFPCSLTAKGRLVGVHAGGIANVRYSNFRARPPLTRIVVNSTRHLVYATEWSSDRTRVSISVMKVGAIAKSKTAPAESAATTVETPAGVAAESVESMLSCEPEGPAVESAANKTTPTISEAVSAMPEVKVAPRAQLTPEERAARAATYKAIAEKSRKRAEPVREPAVVATALPETKSEAISATPEVKVAPRAQLTPEERVARAATYKAIAEKSRKRAEPVREPAIIAAALPETNVVGAAEPTVRVMGMVETTARSSDAAEPVDWEQAGEPKVIVEGVAGKSGATRVAVAIPVKPKADERKVSLNFLGADINDVLKAISVQSGHNVVASKDVTGTVTLGLSNVTVEEALDYVARLSGYTYTKDNGTYLVAQRDSLRTLASSDGSGLATETIKLSYAKADDVIALAKARFPEVQIDKIGVEVTGKVGLESKGSKTAIGLKNSLIVLTGAPDQVKNALELITKFENAFKTQAIESVRETYKVKYVDASELADTLAQLIPGIGIAFAPTEGFKLSGPKGISLDDAGAAVEQDDSDKAMKTETSSQNAQAQTGLMAVTGSGAGTTSAVSRVEKLARPQALIIVGRDSDVKKAVELATELDVKSPQIKIEAKVTSLNKSGEEKLGVSWDWGSFAVKEGFTGYDKTTDSSESPVNKQNVNKPHSAWYRQPWDFSATLEAIFKDGDGQLLASPSLTCMEGKPGVFFVGDDVTYIVRVETTATGQNVLTETKQVGVQLRVVGDTSPDGYITLNLHPEVSVLKLQQDQSANINLPIISRRFTDHVVRVKSGETIVIGGLIRNDELEEMSKVPFLSDMPLLGHLFRHKTKTKDHTEVVMFITATILPD